MIGSRSPIPSYRAGGDWPVVNGSLGGPGAGRAREGRTGLDGAGRGWQGKRQKGRAHNGLISHQDFAQAQIEAKKGRDARKWRRRGLFSFDLVVGCAWAAELVDVEGSDLAGNGCSCPATANMALGVGQLATYRSSATVSAWSAQPMKR